MNDLKQYLKSLKKQGYIIERTKGSHVRIRNKCGVIVGYTGTTPSDHRAVKNLKSRIEKSADNRPLA